MSPIRIAVFVVGWVVAPVLCQAQERRPSFDPASFLQRLDRNGNKMLEPEEMVGRAKGFIENLGVDASGPVPIENVLNAINRERQDADTERAKKEAAKSGGSAWSSPRLIPGFGEESKSTLVPGFGAGASNINAPAADAAREEASTEVIAQVDRVLNQYDQNKDLVLDANEIQNTPWGPPSPQESDSNGDGRLTRAELIERYRKREADSARFNGNNDRNAGGNRNAGGDRNAARSPDNSGGRRRDRRSETTPSSDVSSSPASSTAERSATPRPSSQQSRIADYVQNLIQQYDSNNDGSLGADEQSKMKSVPKGADSDSNGALSRDELVAYYGGGYRQPAPSTDDSKDTAAAEKKPTSGNDAAPRNENRRERRRDSEDPKSSSEFDGQKPIKMQDFTDRWTDEKLNEFRQLDLNHDGVISVEEFRRKNK